MADVLSPEQRQRNMSSIRGKDTKPELLVRRAIHERGLRFRLHCRDLPGTPDIVLPRHRTVIFIHGCFWHAHLCSLAKIPQTRTAFWQEKINGNAARDERSIAILRADGWKVAIVWECALRGRNRLPLALLTTRLVRFIQHQQCETRHFNEEPAQEEHGR